MDAGELKKRMALECESIVRRLYPSAPAPVAGVIKLGSAQGEPGKSLIINLQGPKRGTWHDFNPAEADTHGDLLDLWAVRYGLTVSEAMREVKEHLGITDPRVESPRKKEYAKAKPPPKTKKATKLSKVSMYLRGERGLTQATIDAFEIAEAPFHVVEKGRDRYQEPGPWILFPFIRLDEDGKKRLVNIKYCKIERDEQGKKIIRQAPKTEDTLYGWHTIPPGARQVVITEGEIDAKTVYQWGWPALSLPNGSGVGEKLAWIDNDFERLERFDDILICVDNDDAGRAMIPELIKRLGVHRCRVVKLPHKDPNECLVKYAMQREDVAAFFEGAKYMEPATLVSAGKFLPDVMRFFYPQSEEERGFPLPWSRLKSIRLRLKEVSIFTGITGHGKSDFIGQILCHLMDQGNAGFLASMELPPKDSIGRLVQQLALEPVPEMFHVEQLVNWLGDGRLWIHNVQGRTTREAVLEAMVYARRRYNVRYHVIDSLMRCGIHLDDFQGQSDFVSDLVTFADAEESHVILVAHPAKAQDDTKPLGVMRVKGSGDMIDLAHNIIEIWRNKPNETKLADLQDKPGLSELDRSTKRADLMHNPDTRVLCYKQRNGSSAEPKVRMWYSVGARSWRDSRDGTAPRFQNVPLPPIEGAVTDDLPIT